MFRSNAFVILASATLLQSSPARADFWSNTIHAAEQAANGLGKAAGDVITLGQAGRDRDHEAAERDKHDAEIQLKAAQDAKAQQIESFNVQLRQSNATLEILNSYAANIVLLRSQFGSDLRLTADLAKAVQSNSLRSDYLRAILKSQKTDLQSWVLDLNAQSNGQSVGETDNRKAILAITEKVGTYWMQIEKIPGGDDPTEMIENALRTGSEIQDELAKIQASIEKRVEQTKSEIDSINAALGKLK